MNDYLFMIENSNSINKEEISFWIKHNLSNYLEKYPEITSEIEHILDYFVAHNEPLKLRKISYSQARAASEKWIEQLNKKSNEIIELDEDVKVVLNFEDDYKLVQLIGEDAFKREGTLMSHCVASYFNRESEIYSLRDDKNMPHATFEKNKKDINQIKGKGNGEIHPRYIKYVLKVLEYFKMNIKESELSHLGYIFLNLQQWKFLESNFTGIKYMTFNNKKFFYVRSSLKTIE